MVKNIPVVYVGENDELYEKVKKDLTEHRLPFELQRYNSLTNFSVEESEKSPPQLIITQHDSESRNLLFELYGGFANKRTYTMTIIDPRMERGRLEAYEAGCDFVCSDPENLRASLEKIVGERGFHQDVSVSIYSLGTLGKGILSQLLSKDSNISRVNVYSRHLGDLGEERRLEELYGEMGDMVVAFDFEGLFLKKDSDIMIITTSPPSEREGKYSDFKDRGTKLASILFAGSHEIMANIYERINKEAQSKKTLRNRLTITETNPANIHLSDSTFYLPWDKTISTSPDTIRAKGIIKKYYPWINPGDIDLLVLGQHGHGISILPTIKYGGKKVSNIRSLKGLLNKGREIQEEIAKTGLRTMVAAESLQNSFPYVAAPKSVVDFISEVTTFQTHPRIAVQQPIPLNLPYSKRFSLGLPAEVDYSPKTGISVNVDPKFKFGKLDPWVLEQLALQYRKEREFYFNHVLNSNMILNHKLPSLEEIKNALLEFDERSKN